MPEERIVGIDLGTTNSLVAYMEDDSPVIIPGEDGSNLVPSVVALTQDARGDHIVVGNSRHLGHTEDVPVDPGPLTPYDCPVAEAGRSAFEEYCEAIFELREDDLDVIQARIAERLNVSRPAVSEMIRRLTSEGLVTVDGGIVLTTRGLALAERVVRRHRLAERFLTDILGLSWAEAHLEAGKWEHVLSESVESAINRMLEHPTTCPLVSSRANR